MLGPVLVQLGVDPVGLNVRPEGRGSVTKIFGAVLGPKFVIRIV